MDADLECEAKSSQHTSHQNGSRRYWLVYSAVLLCILLPVAFLSTSSNIRKMSKQAHNFGQIQFMQINGNDAVGSDQNKELDLKQAGFGNGNGALPQSVGYGGYLSQPGYNPYYQLPPYMIPPQYMNPQYMASNSQNHLSIPQFPQTPNFIQALYIPSVHSSIPPPTDPTQTDENSPNPESNQENQLVDEVGDSPSVSVSENRPAQASASERPSLEAICEHLRSITSHPDLLAICEKALAESTISISLEDLEANAKKDLPSATAPQPKTPLATGAIAAPTNTDSNSVLVPIKEVQDMTQLDQYFISKIQELTRSGQLTGLSISIEYAGNNALITFSNKK